MLCRSVEKHELSPSDRMIGNASWWKKICGRGLFLFRGKGTI